jgi:hypothetical protein
MKDGGAETHVVDSTDEVPAPRKNPAASLAQYPTPAGWHL